MSSVFKSTRTVKSSRVVDIPVEDALKAIQDPQVLARLSPLVTDVRQDESDPEIYYIMESMKMLGIIPKTVKIKSRLTKVEDGIDSDTDSPPVHLYSKWRARATEDGRCEVSEEADITGPRVFMGMIEGIVRKARDGMFDALLKKIREQEAASAQ